MQTTAIQHIEMRPSAIHGEKACIAGTRIRVEDIYIWHEVQGMSPHEIVRQFPQLTLGDVHAALTYYWDNEELMQKQMKHGDEIAEQIRLDNPPKLPELRKRLGKDADSLSS
jgi:uncharacterized protein (DUF433 family)